MKENKPCLLLLNDIHISKDNIPAFQSTNWQDTMGICRERDIREVVVGGDLFFSRAAQTLDVLLVPSGICLYPPRTMTFMSRWRKGTTTR
ncbi:hypothetical protein NXV13_10780 [Bacteroides ovatus]|nr:hypothetical protein [Bacteroides ovatus]